MLLSCVRQAKQEHSACRNEHNWFNETLGDSSINEQPSECNFMGGAYNVMAAKDHFQPVHIQWRCDCLQNSRIHSLHCHGLNMIPKKIINDPICLSCADCCSSFCSSILKVIHNTRVWNLKSIQRIQGHAHSCYWGVVTNIYWCSTIAFLLLSAKWSI